MKNSHAIGYHSAAGGYDPCETDGYDRIEPDTMNYSRKCCICGTPTNSLKCPDAFCGANTRPWSASPIHDEVAALAPERVHPPGYATIDDPDGEEMMQAMARPRNPTHHICSTCGYVWAHGQHGGHDCLGNVVKQRDEALAREKFAIEVEVPTFMARAESYKRACDRNAAERDSIRDAADAMAKVLEDLAYHGTRCDTTPTLRGDPERDRVAIQHLLRTGDQHVRTVANAALAAYRATQPQPPEGRGA